MEKESCDCCRYKFKPEDLKEYDVHYDYGPGGPKKKKIKLCKVCAGSLISTFSHYPNQATNSEIIRIIGWGINYLRDEIRKAKEEG